MKREIIEKVFSVFNIKKSTAARILNVKDGTFSQKLKGEKKGYRLFDNEITLIIDKLIKEKIYDDENEDSVTKIGKRQKLKELAEALEKTTHQYSIIKIDGETKKLYEEKNYAEYIIKLIWLEQAAFDGIYVKEQLSQPIEVNAKQDGLANRDLVQDNIQNEAGDSFCTNETYGVGEEDKMHIHSGKVIQSVEKSIFVPLRTVWKSLSIIFILILVISLAANVLFILKGYNAADKQAAVLDSDSGILKIYDRLQLYSEFRGRRFNEGPFEGYLPYNRELASLADRILDNSIVNFGRMDIEHPFGMEPSVHVSYKILNIYRGSPYIQDFVNLIQALYITNKYNALSKKRPYTYSLTNAEVIAHIVGDDNLPYAAAVKGKPKAVYKGPADTEENEYYPKVYLPTTYVFIYKDNTWQLFLASFEE